MTDSATQGPDEGRLQDEKHDRQDQHDQQRGEPDHGDCGHREHHDDQQGEHDRHHHHHRGRGRGRLGRGRPGRRPDLQALLSDQPIGTTAEALAEAFLGVGQLLRARARAQHEGPRRPRGLTFARSALLATLDSDGPQRMGQLAHRLGVVPRTVTPMVDALEGEGLLARDPDPFDRRATLLRITDAGTAELNRTRSDRRGAVDEVFAALDDDERGVLAGVLDKLRAAARAGLDPATVDDRPEGPPGEEGADCDPGARLGGRGRGRGLRERARHDGPHGGPHAEPGHHRARHRRWQA